jgi:transcriptional antiterminator RfaH
MFVRLDLNRDRWRSILGTFGVSGMVMSGERPDPVPRGVVEALLARVDASGALRLGDDLTAGQAVRVMAGPFSEAVGQLERLDANGRVRVLLDIMGGQVPAMISRSALRAA